MQETYRFNKNDFDENGFNKLNGNLILDFIKDCEKDFHKRFSLFYANNLFANYSTMKLIKLALNTKEHCGMDAEFDFDINLKLEDSADIKTIFAIGTAGDEDEPLFLIKDNSMNDGLLILKYIKDDDTENIEPEIPVEKNVLKIK